VYRPTILMDNNIRLRIAKDYNYAPVSLRPIQRRDLLLQQYVLEINFLENEIKILKTKIEELEKTLEREREMWKRRERVLLGIEEVE